VRAESLTVVARRTLYTHPASGAETQLFAVRRRDRSRPMALAEALDLASTPGAHARLLVNTQSGRAAVQASAPSLMLDDGAVERRVRLIRPVDRTTLSETALARSQWREADAGTFAKAWEAELAEVPAWTESTFHIVTGLLLPIWTRLPDESCRVYRLQTDAGERVIGRLVSPAALDGVCRNFGVEGAPAFSAMEAWDAVVDGSATLHLASGLQVRRVSVMGAPRVELVGFTDGAVEPLKALGCMSEKK
jgi:hypothetical protein